MLQSEANRGTCSHWMSVHILSVSNNLLKKKKTLITLIYYLQKNKSLNLSIRIAQFCNWQFINMPICLSLSLGEPKILVEVKYALIWSTIYTLEMIL